MVFRAFYPPVLAPWVPPHLELNRIFATGCDDCRIEALFEQMGLPFLPELNTAVADVLERMEAANKVMYREGLIHLI